MSKFRNKYRIESTRATWWDYTWNGAYFITICTKDMQHFFGTVINEKMVLSPMGVIAELLWYEIPNRSKDIILGEYVIMPNHMHGILILNAQDAADKNAEKMNAAHAADILHVETLHATSVQHAANRDIMDINMPDIYAGDRNAEKMDALNFVETLHTNRLGFENGWHPRYHDHIINNELEFQRISNYIINNPKNWEKKYCGRS